VALEDQSDGLEGLLHDLLAKQEIREVLLRYCRGVDRCDEEVVLSAFHPDAVNSFGGVDQSATERIALVIDQLRTTAVSTNHNLGNVLIAIDGDTAGSESYVVARHRIHDGDHLTDWILGARYIDRFERRDGVWRIIHRSTVFDWDRVDPVSSEPPGEAPAAFRRLARQGLRSREDYSYTSLPI
jgi:hypothetical protein